MNQDKMDYILDFTIPEGPTGPQGFTGPTGPTGPTNIKSILSYIYSNSSISGLLLINFDDEQSILLPPNNPSFTSTNTTITILEDGYYIFSISGILSKTSATGNSSIILNVKTEEFITVIQDERIDDLYFSQTKMKHCTANETVTILFDKDASSDTSTKDINLSITQFIS